MKNSGSVIFLVVFALAIAGSYIAVRRNWTSVVVATAVGVMLGCLAVMLYNLSEGSSFLAAIITGLFGSLVFTGISVAAAAFFKTNTPNAKPPLNPPPTA